MQKHRTSGITQSQRKRTRPKVGQIGLPASLCRSPDGPASRIAPRLAGQTDLAPSHGCISVSFGITAQMIVNGNLLGAEEVAGGDMGDQMNVAQLARQLT